ncbi:MAG: ABC transporter permease [Planctomycetes bacterium]|nr:ABC transporter permease [Planctomycetota bacterium]
MSSENTVDEYAKPRFTFSDFYAKYGVVAVFIIIFALSAFLSPNFLRRSNLFNILRQISIMGILSIGMTCVIISGGIDLSVAAIIALVTVLTADAIRNFGIAAAIVIALATGLLCGLLNGLGVTKGRMPPFIMTLGSTSMLSGLAFIYSKGTPIMIDGPFLDIGNNFLFRIIPLPAVYFIAILVIMALVLNFTVFGRYIYSIGSNREATRLSGVNVDWVLIKVYMISGLLAAVSGIIYSSQLGIGQPIAGVGYELKAITAVIVGGASMNGGVGNMFGTFLGAAIIGILGNIMNLTGVNPFVQTFLTGVILILAVLIRKDR